MTNFKFKPDGDVLKAFMKSDAFFRGLRGPVDQASLLAAALSCFADRCNRRKAQMGYANLAGLL